MSINDWRVMPHLLRSGSKRRASFKLRSISMREPASSSTLAQRDCLERRCRVDVMEHRLVCGASERSRCVHGRHRDARACEGSEPRGAEAGIELVSAPARECTRCSSVPAGSTRTLHSRSGGGAGTDVNPPLPLPAYVPLRRPSLPCPDFPKEPLRPATDSTKRTRRRPATGSFRAAARPAPVQPPDQACRP